MNNFNNKIPLIFFLIIFFFTAYKISAQTNLEYILSMEKPFNHYFQVEMKISELNNPDSIEVKMPVWAPGSYKIRDFPKNVENFKVQNNEGKNLRFKKVDKNTWRIFTQKLQSIKINYDVYAFEYSIRSSFLDESHGYINGTSVFMFIDGMKNLPSTLKINPYKGMSDGRKGWEKISTGLEKIGTKENKFYAENYDILADSPIEMGNHEVYHFNASGVNHEVAIYGGGNYEPDILLNDLKKIVEAETKIFGENPNKNYVFIIHNSDKRGGGLEHLNSTTVEFTRFSYKPESSYKRNLKTLAHEYFHLWNVKRIRPVQLGPFNYNKENYTPLLWAMEGITDYYANLILKRTGIFDEDEFLKSLSGTISRIENQPGNKIQSAAEASFDAWIKYYQPNENSYNTTISYYQKGYVLGALLDLEIINSTNGEKSLDDLMKYIYNEYYKKKERGLTALEWKAAAEKIAGKNLDDFFNEYVFGTEKINYQKYFNYAGIEILEYENDAPFLGIQSQMRDGKLLINVVKDSTPAYFGKLNAGDEIIAANGYRVDKDLLEKIISSSNAGDSLQFTVSRNGILKKLIIVLKQNEEINYGLFRNAEPIDKQNQVYNKWLFKQ